MSLSVTLKIRLLPNEAYSRRGWGVHLANYIIYSVKFSFTLHRFWTDKSVLTVQTQFNLLQEEEFSEQSNQGLHYL